MATDRIEVAGFDWDEGNLVKCQKHGVSISEVEAVFRYPHRLAPDLAHSRRETRSLAIGNGGGSRPIFVAFTLRHREGEVLIRAISARYMHRKEIAAYEESIAQAGE
jgi:uncharacterized DUF497 family protein